MAGLYIDTSALARVMLGEPDTPAITAVLASFEQHFSSRLLAIELRRVALREAMPAVADALLGSVALVPLDEAILVHAETVMPATVATLDALHLAYAELVAVPLAERDEPIGFASRDTAQTAAAEARAFVTRLTCDNTAPESLMCP